MIFFKAIFMSNGNWGYKKYAYATRAPVEVGDIIDEFAPENRLSTPYANPAKVVEIIRPHDVKTVSTEKSFSEDYEYNGIPLKVVKITKKHNPNTSATVPSTPVNDVTRVKYVPTILCEPDLNSDSTGNICTASAVYDTPCVPISSMAEDYIKSEKNKSNEPKEMEKKTMNLFSNMNLDFGKVTDKNIAYSIKGIAVSDGKTFKAYCDNDITDVSGFVIDGIPLFKMPVATASIEVGDVIVHNGKYVHVKEMYEDGTLHAIDIALAQEIVIVPVKNMFNFNFYTKVVNPLGNLVGTPDSSNPFGNILPLMMLNKDDGDNSMLLMAMMMGQNGATATGGMNPMMMMALMGEKSDNKDMLMAMAMSGAVKF